MHGLEWRVPAGQVGPGGAGAENPQDGLQDGPGRGRRAALAIGPAAFNRNQRLNQSPLRVCKVHADCIGTRNPATLEFSRRVLERTASAASPPALLCRSGHALMESCSDIIMALEIGEASGYAGHEAATRMLKHMGKRHRLRPKELGEDKGYRGKEHTRELEKLRVAQHITGHNGRKPRGWTARQRCWRPIEKVIGRGREVAGWIGRWKTKLYLLASGAAYNLLMLSNLGVA